MSQPECRICLEASGSLISVCECKGHAGYVHAACIEKWITESGRDSCEICQADFKTTVKHTSSKYCCTLCVQNTFSLGIPEELQTKQIELSSFIFLSQIIMYLLYGYGSYIVVTLLITFMLCFMILTTFLTCSFESRFYIQNFALRLLLTSLIIRFVFLVLAYMDMSTMYSSCLGCISIMSRCRWTCKEDMEYAKKIMTQLDSIVYQSIFSLGSFIILKVVMDTIVSSKVLSIVPNEAGIEEEENAPLITEV